MNNNKLILVINPGGSSTKIAVYRDNKPLFTKNIRHTLDELTKFANTLEQHTFREETIVHTLKEKGINLEDLDAIVGRGGPFKPMSSGTYLVDEDMLNNILEGKVLSDHPSNLGALIAYNLALDLNIPSYIVDPVSVDEFDEIAYISGLPEIKRTSLSHALNIKAIARRIAKDLEQPYKKLNLIIVHLGSGISITAHHNGRMIDVNEDMGPFSPQRTGALPSKALVRLCYSGKYTSKEMEAKIMKKGGLLAYLGTDNVYEIIKRIDNGDEEAKLIFDAFIYQIAKEIGAYSTVLYGKVDTIVITGGIANEKVVTDKIEERVGWIAPVKIYAGEDELEALALGALRVLKGEEKAKKY